MRSCVRGVGKSCLEELLAGPNSSSSTVSHLPPFLLQQMLERPASRTEGAAARSRSKTPLVDSKHTH